MPEIHGPLLDVLVVWGIVTAVLVILLVYRGTLEVREDDQIFLDSAGDSMAQEQRLIVARIERLARPIKLLMITSILLLIAAGGFFLYDGYQRF
ncbi:MAG TPA: hypothetical protein VIH97_01865 [Candidatus Acidoferrales bacterium]|jgi:hypothetical protein